jgi:N-acyl-D-aspartate/D-glutamate deacylase
MLGQSGVRGPRRRPGGEQDHPGITTEVTGEEARSPLNDRMIAARAPSYRHFGVEQDFRTLGEYFHRIETRSRIAINIATFVGAGGVRDYVIGPDRKATEAELEEMKKLVAQAMEDGALGLHLAQYVPHRFASTEELVELAKVAASYGGIYHHQRSESGRIFESLDIFAIAERASIPPRSGTSRPLIARTGEDAAGPRAIEAARARGST